MEIVNESTRKRLEQVKFILAEMEITFKEDNLTKFDIDLNNFITNARTITFLLQNEFSKCEGFTDWYNNKKEEMKCNGFDNFKDMRNIIEKQGNLRNTAVFHITVTDKDEPGAQLLTTEISKNGKQKNKTYGKFKLKPFFGELGSFDLNKLDEDAIQQSKNYFNYLSNLVDESYTKFTRDKTKKETS
ncbi:Uncharacterised protein [uncultured archaeon]|nr:Uncharacterised protein [uncultured archaeon]